MSYIKTTGTLYTTLFSDYSPELFEKSVELQVDRFRRWNLPVQGAVCLDVGCGGGRTLVALTECGARVVHGIDIDEKLVALARKRSGVEVVCGNVLELPYKDNMFDVVISSGVLHHTPDIGQGIREIQRVLKPGGTFYLMLYLKHRKWIGTKIMRLFGKVVPFPNLRKILFFIPANKRYTMDNWYVPYMHVLGRDEILSLLNGFQDIREEDKGRPAHNLRLVMRKVK